MRQFGLIGYPLTSSFSKRYFAEKFEREQITGCAYDNYPLANINEFPALLEHTRDLHGLNVTIPYKVQVMPYLHEVTAAVQQMNACNCIRIVDGRLYGHNTDVTGFEQSFLPLRKHYHQSALVLGTGGAAAAVEYVLQKLQIPYLLVTRSTAGKSNSIPYDSLNERLMKNHLVIINTTPLGMAPDVDSAPPIPYEYLTPEHYLYDLVYNPAETLFLKRGVERGATTKNGADMLVIQAEESWKIWNDKTI
ncbi:shikimate dehydrogenase [Segetibacter sp. 3557_3]|uniref:shikimate dehydrogenase family protein n=1 Tax=Segetibacter sp. 3557_3 TaxID=2547429 RepID=UPI0010587245|nr:shikimate dehydrogenase [Segetibacter sp. 3557_3]TDH26821.1 shikimate dehydrogenase [Segetibacter sp. 3557_3]